MKKVFFIVTLMSVYTLLFLNSCTNEDPASEAKADLININQAREHFSNTPIKLKTNLYFSNEIDWEKGHFENDTLSIPILSNKPILIKRLKNPNSSKYLYPFLLVTKNKSNNTFDYNLKVFISTNSNGYNKDSFHLYDINNKLILNTEKSVYKKTSKTSKNSRVAGCQLWGRFSINNETGEETLLYTWWECSGSSQPEQVPPGDGSSSEPVSCGSGYIQDEYGNCVSATQAIEDNIDDSKLDLCSKTILDKLKNATNADIKSIFDKLGGKSDVYTLSFEIGNNYGNPASTNWTSSNCYKTVIDNDFLYGIDGTGINKPPTDLAIGAVMIHEIVHAYFFSLLDDKNSGITSAFDNFDLLYQNYVTKTYAGADDAQHAQIWKSFIGSLASTLQEYQTGNGANPSQFYTDIILGTLSRTQIFADKYPQGTADYRRIMDNYRTEISNGKTVPNSIPIGKICK